MSKTRSNNEGNIKLRADGRYEVRVTVDYDKMTGKPKRVSKYAKTKEEAVKLLNQMSFLNDTSPNNFTRVTLGDWLDLCLEVYMKNTLKQSTYLSYESYIRVHLKPALGDVILQELTPRTLQLFYNYKAEVEGLSAKTIVNINLFLHRALKFAVAEGYINSNPASSVNLPSGDRPQITILTRDEQMRLIQGSYQHRYGVFIRLVLFTGIRLGELLGLRWEDVDVQGRRIYIRRTLNRLNKTQKPKNSQEASTEIVIQTPKSQNSIRSIPLLPQVLQDLQGWQRVQQSDRQAAGEIYEDSGFLVTNPLGGYVYEGPVFELISDNTKWDGFICYEYKDFSWNDIACLRLDPETKTWTQSSTKGSTPDAVWETISEFEANAIRSSFKPISLDMKPLSQFNMNG